MYGDTDVMRKHAGRLREQGGDIRALADQLVAQSENLHWTGRAADAMRERVRERAARLRDVAARHETAATALETPRARGRRAQGHDRRRERRSRALVADGSVADFERPAPGHKDWLGREPAAAQSADGDGDHRPRPTPADPHDLLDGLPRRVALTLPELRLVAEGGRRRPAAVRGPRAAAGADSRSTTGSAEPAAPTWRRTTRP